MKLKHILLTLILGTTVSVSVNSFNTNNVVKSINENSTTTSNTTNTSSTNNNSTETTTSNNHDIKPTLVNNNSNDTITLTIDPYTGILEGTKMFDYKKGVTYGDIKEHLNNNVRVTKEGVRVFPGWVFISQNGGSCLVEDNTVFDCSGTLRPNYKFYYVYFDAGSGKFKDEKNYKEFRNVTIVHSDELDNPTLKGAAFEGWYYNDTKIEKFPFIPEGDTYSITVKAKYTSNKINLMFTAGADGKFKNGDKVKSLEVPYGTKSSDPVILKPILDDIPSYKNKTKTFAYYQYGSTIMSDITFYQASLMTAVYTDQLTITFNVSRNGGKWTDYGTSSDKSCVIYPSLTPTFGDIKSYFETYGEKGKLANYKQEGSARYNLLGWYKDSKGVYPIDDSENVSTSLIVYACYDVSFNFNSSGDFTCSGDTTFKPSQARDLTIYINPKLGYSFTGESHSLSYYYGNKLVENQDYTFTYNQSAPTSAATLVIKKEVVKREDFYFTLNLTKLKYNLNFSYSEGLAYYEGGGAKSYGDSVYVKAYPIDGYVVKSISSSSGKSSTGNSLSFSMPNNDVVISCVCEKATYTISKQDPIPAEINYIYTDKETAKYGDIVNVTVAPNTGNAVKNIKIKNKTTSEVYKTFEKENKIEFMMPAFDVLIEAEAGVIESVISFNGNGGTPDKQSEVVTYGSKVTRPSNPIRKNYVFGGWYTDEGCTEGHEFSFDTPITTNLNLYARWLAGELTIVQSKKNIDPNSTAKFTLKVGEVEIKNDMKWSSSEESIATVDNNGNVLGVGAGHCTISVTYNDRVASTNDFEVGSFSKLDEDSLKDGKIYRKDKNISGKLLVPARYWSEDSQEFITLKFYNDGRYFSSLKDGAFYECKNITSVDIAEGIYTIGGSAFENCNSITSIILPNGVTYINSFAFYNCSSLESIHIPASVKAIRATSLLQCDAFIGCTKLTLVVVDSTAIAKLSNEGNIFDPLENGKKTVKIPEGTEPGWRLKNSYTKTGTEGGYDIYMQNFN